MFDDLNNLEISKDLIGAKAQKLDLDRRGVLKLGVAGLLASIVPLVPTGQTLAANSRSWRVALHNAHTGESYKGVYRVGDTYLPEAFDKINYFLRDFRTREVFPMDPRVIDIVSIVQSKTGTNKSLEVLSGYRSPKTNAGLRNASTGVAKNSFHMYGQAMDIRLPGYSTARLRDVARSLRAGGVGYYSSSNFVHVDTGTVRSW